MTFRLVGLMSVVLLLSLGAFGLLVSHYQEQVMREVERTASAVGQETLRHIEFRDSPSGSAAYFPAPQGDVVIWHSSFGTADVGPAAEGEPALVSHLEETELRDLLDRLEADGGDAVARDGGGRKTVRVRRRVDRPHVQVTCGSDVESAGAGSDCEAEEASVHVAGQFLIRVDEVRAETDPTQGLVLRIPRIDPSTRQTIEVTGIGVSGRAPAAPPVIEDAIELPIPTGDYQSLFDSMRKRSLVLLFGVFLVGTVLSAGLAARFTRPIRKLDAGLRRLSDGDLDVEVEVRGKGEVARLGRAFNDMTSKLRASRRREKELVRRDKLSALGRLAAGVAHDVRNPLHSISLTLDHLQDTGRPDDPGRATEFDRSLGIIRGEIKRLDRLVANFLLFATSERRERRAVDVRELLRETARLVGKEAEWRGVRVELALDESVAPIHADEESIRSSILNLVVNSFEAMPRGGELSLILRSQPGGLVVEVADTGEGIPAENRERVFDFAYTTREGGSGLGLAMVHQYVVEELGGRVALDSRPGKGTRLQLFLPHRAEERVS